MQTDYDIVHSIYKYICGITQIGSAVIGESFKGYMCIFGAKADLTGEDDSDERKLQNQNQ